MTDRSHFCRFLATFIRRPASQEELAHLLGLILTPSELESLAQRLSILEGLSLGTSQRDIAEKLGVGIATVTRGSRVWQDNKIKLAEYFPILDNCSATQNSSLKSP